MEQEIKNLRDDVRACMTGIAVNNKELALMNAMLKSHFDQHKAFLSQAAFRAAVYLLSTVGVSFGLLTGIKYWISKG